MVDVVRPLNSPKTLHMHQCKHDRFLAVSQGQEVTVLKSCIYCKGSSGGGGGGGGCPGGPDPRPSHLFENLFPIQIALSKWLDKIPGSALYLCGKITGIIFPWVLSACTTPSTTVKLSPLRTVIEGDNTITQ